MLNFTQWLHLFKALLQSYSPVVKFFLLVLLRNSSFNKSNKLFDIPFISPKFLFRFNVSNICSSHFAIFIRMDSFFIVTHFKLIFPFSFFAFPLDFFPPFFPYPTFRFWPKLTTQTNQFLEKDLWVRS